MSEPLADRPASWPVHERRTIHRDDWVVSVREDVISPPGAPEERYPRITVEHPGAVVVLAVDEQERVLCLRQYRHSSQHEFIELPAGIRDTEGEPPEETARRELQEEAELAAGRWTPLLSTYSSAGVSTEVHDIFLARDLREESRGDFELRGEEARMTRFWVPMADLLEAALAGRVRQGPLVQAVLAYDVLARQGRLDDA